MRKFFLRNHLKYTLLYLNLPRVSQATYSRYETGRLDIPSQTLIALARYYGVSVDYLLGLDHRR